MSAGEMSDGTPVTPEFDARMLAELREWRRRYPIASMHGITGDELDMLLRAVDERDALKRELVDMPDDHLAPLPVRSVPFTAEIPAEIRERAGEPAHAARHGHPGEPCRDRSACYPGDRSTEPVHSDEIRERSGEPAMRTPGVCSRCGGRLYYSVPSHAWVHSGAVPKGCVPRPTPRPDRAEPTPAYQWRAAGCVWGGDRMGAEAAMRHYARMHGGRLERRVAAGPWTATS